MKKVNREVVAALLFSRDQKLFIAYRSFGKGKVYPDTWHIPGGGVEWDENHRDALVREIKEELGLDIIHYQIKLVDDKGTGESVKLNKKTKEEEFVSMKFYVYRIDIDDKESSELKVKLNDEFEEYRWIALDELRNYKLPPPSVYLFKRLGWLE